MEKKGWHFLRKDCRLRYEDDRLVVPGETLRYKKKSPIKLCKRGLHASVKARDALFQAPGPIACRVTVGGKILEGESKFCGEWRRVEWMVDAENILHEFACRCAEDALSLFSDPNPRSLASIAAKRSWVRGEIDYSALDEAHLHAHLVYNGRFRGFHHLGYTAAARASYFRATDSASLASNAAARAVFWKGNPSSGNANAFAVVCAKHNRRLVAMLSSAPKILGPVGK